VIPSQEADNTKGEGRHARDATAHHWTRSEPVPPRDGILHRFQPPRQGLRSSAVLGDFTSHIGRRASCLSRLSVSDLEPGPTDLEPSRRPMSKPVSSPTLLYWIRTSFRSPPLAFLYLGVVQTDEAGLTDTHFLLVTGRS
jgi:hypothetical protein